MTKRSLLRYCLFISVLIFADQVSKIFLIDYFKNQPEHVIEILPFFDIVYAWNYGISFGLFRRFYKYSNLIFLFLNSFIVLYLIHMLRKSKEYKDGCALALIIGGALGNLIDRLFHGAVFDFLFFNYSELSFPAFNLADSFITIGGFLFIYRNILKKEISLDEKK